MKTNTMELKVLQAIMEVEERKAYEDEVTVNTHEVLDNLDSYSIYTRSTVDNLLVITHIVNLLINDGYVKVIDNDNFTFRSTLTGYLYYEQSIQ